MIRLEKVIKLYGKTVAVDGLSFEVDRGEVCVLIGPSGCGKTTTLRMINRLTEPTSGHIFINEQDNATVPPERLRRSIGYAIQSVGLFPHMTVATNIAAVPQLLHWDKKRIAGRVEELLALVGLNPAEYAPKYPHELSGGEAQRIGVARALAADPPILLMDEPFGAVDPLTRQRLQRQFIRIQQELKKTVVLVTHDLDEAIRLGDRIAIMQAGRLLQYDTADIILSRPVNKFVHDFVGADRALKRLSRIPVEGFIKPAPSVPITAPIREVYTVCTQCRWVWVVDERNRLLGWVDRENLSMDLPVRETMVSGNREDISVGKMDTLRDALSRMLGQGFKNIPVVDADGTLIGQVALGDVEAATAEAEAQSA